MYMNEVSVWIETDNTISPILMTKIQYGQYIYLQTILPFLICDLELAAYCLKNKTKNYSFWTRVVNWLGPTFLIVFCPA